MLTLRKAPHEVSCWSTLAKPFVRVGMRMPAAEQVCCSDRKIQTCKIDRPNSEAVFTPSIQEVLSVADGTFVVIVAKNSVQLLIAQCSNANETQAYYFFKKLI